MKTNLDGKFVWYILTILLFSCADDDLPVPENGSSSVLNTETFKISGVGYESEEYTYDFVLPINFDLWLDELYNPGDCNNYTRDGFGPRLLSKKFDNHAGFDITSCGKINGEQFDDTNPPVVYSMSDGIVEEIDENNKCSIYIKSNSVFNGNPDWGHIYFIYRHNSEILTKVGATIKKGEAIAVIGNCDASKYHLHLSIRPEKNNNGKNVNPSRVFNPKESPYLEVLTKAEIRILASTVEQSIIRLAIPGNQGGLNEIQIKDESTEKQWVYNFENVIRDANGSDERDDPRYIDGLEIYAYGYDGETPACEKYTKDAADLTKEYPASPARGEGNFYPIECEGYSGQVSQVYDVVVKEKLTQPVVTLTDVWGYQVIGLKR